MSLKPRTGGRWRRGLIAAASLAVVLVAADTAVWWMVTSRLATETQAWRLARVAQGMAVTSGAAVRAGWPWRAELIVPEVLLATGTPGSAGAMAWRVGGVRLTLSPWQPWQLMVAAEGEQSVQLGTAPATRLDAAMLGVAVPLDGGVRQDVTVTGRGLGLEAQGGAVGVDVLWLRLEGLHAQMALSGVSLPGRGLPFGGTVETVSLQADATAGLPPGQDMAVAAAAWRNGGGRLTLSHVAVRWGPVDMSGEVTLGLDAGLQPEGAGRLHVAGYQQAIEAMVRSGTMTRNDARVAGTLLSLVSGTASDGAAEVDLPIGLHGGIVSVGAFPLLRLPALAFP